MEEKRFVDFSLGGFSLIEIMIALTIFAIFSVAFLGGQGNNIHDSIQMKEEMTLAKLCENKIQEILLKPPVLSTSLTLAPQTGTFEEEDFPDYEFKVEYQQLKLPDLSLLSSIGPSGEDEEDQDEKVTAHQKKIFSLMKKNVENLVWQVRVTVNKKGVDFPYTLSSWLRNPKGKVQVSL